MDVYRTEDEQIQVLKKWWSDNGVSLLATIAIAMAAIFGWRAWQQQQQANVDAAAFAFQSLIQAVAAASAAPDDIKIASAMHIADSIKQDFSGTGYAHFAALAKAKQALADVDYALAETELRWVLENSPSTELRAIAELRLARVLLASGSADGALALLQAADEQAASSKAKNATTTFAPQRAELAGDIHMIQGQYQLAHDSYTRARSSAEAASLTVQPLLDAKTSYAKSYL